MAVLGLIAVSVAAVAIVALSGDLNDSAVVLLSVGSDGVCPCPPSPPPGSNRLLP